MTIITESKWKLFRSDIAVEFGDVCLNVDLEDGVIDYARLNVSGCTPIKLWPQDLENLCKVCAVALVQIQEARDVYEQEYALEKDRAKAREVRQS